jgi:hypothetical protein
MCLRKTIMNPTSQAKNDKNHHATSKGVALNKIGDRMLKDILSIFSSNSVHRLALVASIGSNILKTFEQEFANDLNSKDAAIDTLVELLQSHKGVAPAAPAQPQA